MNFKINEIELLKFEGLTSKNDTIFIQIFKYMDQNWCKYRNMFGQ